MKFAYLIMAHDNFTQLKYLLALLDWEENDIFLHIDKKAYFIKEKELVGIIKKARIHIYRKFKVFWGDISQTRCQGFLLSEAVQTYHDYYHLISGHDLPIKKHDVILDFFEQNRGKEFVHFESDNFCAKDECKYYSWGRTIIAKKSINIQKAFGVNRRFYCGANWYSITHRLATDFCNNQNRMLSMIKWTKNSDEYILQTFIRMISDKKYYFYKHTDNPYDYGGTARLIDWHRGQPYVWRKDNFDELMNSDRMFARKFDEKIDFEIIKMVVDRIYE